MQPYVFASSVTYKSFLASHGGSMIPFHRRRVPRRFFPRSRRIRVGRRRNDGVRPSLLRSSRTTRRRAEIIRSPVSRTARVTQHRFRRRSSAPLRRIHGAAVITRTARFLLRRVIRRDRRGISRERRPILRAILRAQRARRRVRRRVRRPSILRSRRRRRRRRFPYITTNYHHRLLFILLLQIIPIRHPTPPRRPARPDVRHSRHPSPRPRRPRPALRAQNLRLQHGQFRVIHRHRRAIRKCVRSNQRVPPPSRHHRHHHRAVFGVRVQHLLWLPPSTRPKFGRVAQSRHSRFRLRGRVVQTKHGIFPRRIFFIILTTRRHRRRRVPSKRHGAIASRHHHRVSGRVMVVINITLLMIPASVLHHPT